MHILLTNNGYLNNDSAAVARVMNDPANYTHITNVIMTKESEYWSDLCLYQSHHSPGVLERLSYVVRRLFNRVRSLILGVFNPPKNTDDLEFI